MRMPPSPTVNEILHNRDFATGRITIAWHALKRILLDELPPALEEAARLEQLPYPVPRTCSVAPEPIAEAFPTWAIASTVVLRDFSFASMSDANTVLFLGYGHMLSLNDIVYAHEVLDLAISNLYSYRAGHQDDHGRHAWDSISPGSIEYVKNVPGWENAQGLALMLNIQQMPGSPRWKSPDG